MNLKQRIERLETGMKTKQLRAAIQGFVSRSSSAGKQRAPGALSPDDPRLKLGVDEEGEAIISRWWSVWFFEGAKEQQTSQLKELRLDPEFQKPWNVGDIPIRYEGAAQYDDLILRLSERKRCR